ncbi:hypothetical protein NDU88_007659 [Pleurodeles waltl]|uniref:Uncharacterized protein n=1 Tax=Pleurodeles waltl TaxID=8319 RepID=A0AAV7U2Y6_PLEWA|nr:hypothetical protein NDU88_007659 [Pleurodeles waltl]
MSGGPPSGGRLEVAGGGVTPLILPPEEAQADWNHYLGASTKEPWISQHPGALPTLERGHGAGAEEQPWAQRNHRRRGQRPSEKGAMESHHQEGADPGGPQLAGHPLSEKVGDLKR